MVTNEKLVTTALTRYSLGNIFIWLGKSFPGPYGFIIASLSEEDSEISL